MRFVSFQKVVLVLRRKGFLGGTESYISLIYVQEICFYVSTILVDFMFRVVSDILLLVGCMSDENVTVRLLATDPDNTIPRHVVVQSVQ